MKGEVGAYPSRDECARWCTVYNYSSYIVSQLEEEAGFIANMNEFFFFLKRHAHARNDLGNAQTNVQRARGGITTVTVEDDNWDLDVDIRAERDQNLKRLRAAGCNSLRSLFHS